MKSRNTSKDNDLIDIGKLFKSIWNDKFTILAISTIFSIIGYLYGTSLPQYFETTVKIRSIPETTFKEYNDILRINIENSDFSVDEFFNKEFLLLLESSETLNKFSKKNTEGVKFFPHIANRDISINYNRNTKTIKSHTINFTITLNKNLQNQ